MEIDKKEYGNYVKQVTPVHNTWKNLWRAFLVGGLICMLGQILTSVYMSFGIEKESAASWTTLSLIGLSVILTGTHIYQKIVKFGGAGALVPITGFANSVLISSPLENANNVRLTALFWASVLLTICPGAAVI